MASIIEIKLDDDDAWPDLRDLNAQGKVLHHVERPIGLAVLDGGMVSGKPSVAFRFDWPESAGDGARVMVAECSWAVLAAAARAIAARYGWPE
jgi:hypothetical protein